MATVTRYVNTASSAGGDGTTNATTGANRAYASLNEWEAAEQTDLVTATDSHIVHCEGTAADTAVVIVDGWGTDATYYITVQVDADKRHDGKWDITAYRLDGVNEPYLFRFKENGKVFGVQFRNVISDHFKHGIEMQVDGQAVSEMAYCLVYIVGNYVAVGIIQGPYSWTSTARNMYNNVIWSNSAYVYSGNSGIYILINAVGYPYVLNFFNNTIIGFNTCVEVLDSDVTVVAKNNIVSSGATANVSVVTESGSDYNASSSASNFDSGGGHNRDSQTFTFVDAGNQDFHLASNDAGALGYGVTDPGSGLFSDDIDGVARSAPWDIGADEYVAPAAGGMLPRHPGMSGGMSELLGGMRG